MSQRGLTDRLRQLLGAAAVSEPPATQPPLVLPADEAACALLLRTASAEGWRVAIVGTGGWMTPPQDVDVQLGTSRLQTLGPIDAADLVATAEAGVRWDALRTGLADRGTWLACDVPGGNRSLGSVLATGTAGPLRGAFGPLRDHVLGLTLVSGDGRVLRVGGRVVKNVAGYDVGKLALGTFGAFGVIVRAHLRLRTVPSADCTLLATGSRDALIDIGRAILADGLTPAALELISGDHGGGDWRLAIRLVGADAEAEADRRAIQGVLPAVPTVLRGDDAAGFWVRTLTHPTTEPVTLRIGAELSVLEDALDLVALHLDEAVRFPVSVSLLPGVVRWSGAADATAVLGLRRAAAEHEWPLTLERAPAETLSAVGHFGAYREGVFHLVQRLRAAFDPAGTLRCTLDAA